MKEEGRPELSGARIRASWAFSQVLSLPVSSLQLTVQRERHDKQQPPWWSGRGEGGRRGRTRSRMRRRKSVMFRGHTRWFVLINSKVRKNKPVLIQPNSTLFYLIFWGGGQWRRQRIWGQQCCVMRMGEGDPESQRSQPLAAATEKINTPPPAYLHKGLT